MVHVLESTAAPCNPQTQGQSMNLLELFIVAASRDLMVRIQHGLSPRNAEMYRAYVAATEIHLRARYLEYPTRARGHVVEQMTKALRTS